MCCGVFPVMGKIYEKKNCSSSLIFSGDHPVSQYPDKDRNAIVKELVEQALASNDTLKEIQKELRDIKAMLSSGTPCKPEPITGIKLSDSDIALIDQILGKN